MLKKIDDGERVKMTVEQMELMYKGLSILYIDGSDGVGMEVGVPVAVSDFTGVRELKSMERDYKKNGYETAIAVSDFDDTTFTVEKFEAR